MRLASVWLSNRLVCVICFAWNRKSLEMPASVGGVHGIARLSTGRLIFCPVFNGTAVGAIGTDSTVNALANERGFEFLPQCKSLSSSGLRKTVAVFSENWELERHKTTPNSIRDWSLRRPGDVLLHPWAFGVHSSVLAWPGQLMGIRTKRVERKQTSSTFI